MDIRECLSLFHKEPSIRQETLVESVLVRVTRLVRALTPTHTSFAIGGFIPFGEGLSSEPSSSLGLL